MLRLLRKPAGTLAARAQTQVRAVERIGPSAVARSQTVRIHGRSFSLRRIAFNTAVFYICYRIYGSVVLSPLVEAAEKELESLSDKEREELESSAANESLFVPFPFTTRQIDPQPYRGDDPEWQMFIKISMNTELQKKIRGDLANLVKSAAEKNPMLVYRSGANSMKVRRSWLDIDFPYRPSPTFEQSGLRIDDDGIFWATEPVDSLTVMRVKKMLWPSAMAQSTFVFGQALFWQQLGDLKEAFGFRPNDASQGMATTHSQRLNFQERKERRAMRPAASRQTPEGIPAESSSTSEDKSHSTNAANDSSGGATRFPKEAPKDDAREGFSIPESIQRSVRDPFKQSYTKFAQTWKQTVALPPRGCIFISGLVELETPKAVMVVDVSSWWDPATKKFDPRSMWLHLRRFEFKQQRPLR